MALIERKFSIIFDLYDENLLVRCVLLWYVLTFFLFVDIYFTFMYIQCIYVHIKNLLKTNVENFHCYSMLLFEPL